MIRQDVRRFNRRIKLTHYPRSTGLDDSSRPLRLDGTMSWDAKTEWENEEVLDSSSPPDRNIWCQINLDASGAVKDVICQGNLPTNAPLVDGVKPNSIVLEADPSKQKGAHFAVLDSRIVDFVPPLQTGETIQVLAIECTASGSDELTCTANKGGATERGFTISSRAFEFR